MLGKMGKTDIIYPVSHLAIPVQADTMPVFKCAELSGFGRDMKISQNRKP